MMAYPERVTSSSLIETLGTVDQEMNCDASRRSFNSF